MATPARVAFLAVPFLLAFTGCTSSHGPSQTQDCTPIRGGCACPGGTEGRRMLDGCTAAPVTACECPTAEACQLADGYPGTKACFGTDCGGCTATLADGKALWTADVPGVPIGFSPAVDGGGYVLLTSSPWIARFDASGKPAPFTVHETFGWARVIVADADGSVILLGVPSAIGSPGPITVKRLDALGVAIATTSWGTTASTTVFGAVLDQAKEVLVAALQGASIVVGRVTADTTVVPVGSIDNAGSYKRNPVRLVAGPKGDILLAGTAKDQSGSTGPWVALMSSAGVLLADAAYTTSAFGFWSAAMNANGEIYLGGMANLDTAFLSRLDRNLQFVWTRKAVNLHLRAVIGVPDGVLGVGDSFSRLDRLGQGVPQQPFFGPGSFDAQPAGEHQILLLGTRVGSNNQATYQLERAQIGDALGPAGPQVAGGLCFVDADCASARCCTDGGSAGGKCSSVAACPVGSRCTVDSDCTGGVCLKTETAPSGTCKTPCTGTAQCPSAEVCASRPCGFGAVCPTACFPSCTANASCGVFAGQLTCYAGETTEHVSASFCH